MPSKSLYRGLTVFIVLFQLVHSDNSLVNSQKQLCIDHLIESKLNFHKDHGQIERHKFGVQSDQTSLVFIIDMYQSLPYDSVAVRQKIRSIVMEFEQQNDGLIFEYSFVQLVDGGQFDVNFPTFKFPKFVELIRFNYFR